MQPTEALRRIRETFAPSPSPTAGGTRGSATTTQPDQPQPTDPKSVPITYDQYLQRETERKMTPEDRLLFLEMEAPSMSDIKDIPTKVLEKELAIRRQSDTDNAAIDNQLEVAAAEAFGRKPRTATGSGDATDTEVTEADLDRASSALFGRKEK